AGGGTAAPLQMAQNRDAGLVVRVLTDVLGHPKACRFFVAAGRTRHTAYTFRYDHDAVRLAGLMYLVDLCYQVVEVLGNLRNQDGLGTYGQSRVQRYVTRIAPHDLDDVDTVMAVRGITQLVHGVNHGVECRIEPDGHVGARDVVIDGARYSDGRHALPVKRQRAREGTVAADHDKALNPGTTQMLNRLRSALPRHELVRTGA